MTTPAFGTFTLLQDCISSAFELIVIQQPTGIRNQYGTNVLDPFPVCHLRPRWANRNSPLLHPHLLLQCHLESIPAQSTATPLPRTIEPTLKGQTVVGPRFGPPASAFHASSSTATLTEHASSWSGGMQEAWFVYRDLGVEGDEGDYRLRFSLMETAGLKPHVCAEVWSSSFRLNMNGQNQGHDGSSDLFSGFTTNLPLHLSSPREYRVPMIRRRYQPQRSAASKPGLPELPGLASAIYRPEPRSRARTMNERGSASVASTSRRSGTRDGRQSRKPSEDASVEVTHGEVGRLHSHSLSASSSLPSLSVLFPTTTGSSNQARSSEQGSSMASLPSNFGSISSTHADSLPSSRHAAGTGDRRRDSLRNSELSQRTSPNTLTKKQSAPARLITARMKPGTGHQVGSTSREKATRRSDSRERGPILPASIRRQLSRQSTPAHPAASIEGDNDGDIEMLAEEAWNRSPRCYEQRSRHDFRSPRTSPSRSSYQRGLPLPLPRREDRTRLPHRTTSPHEVVLRTHQSSSNAKMGISNLLS